MVGIRFNMAQRLAIAPVHILLIILHQAAQAAPVAQVVPVAQAAAVQAAAVQAVAAQVAPAALTTQQLQSSSLL